MNSTSFDKGRAALISGLAPLLLPLSFACSSGDLAAGGAENEDADIAEGEQALIALPSPSFCSIALCPAGTICNEQTRSCDPAVDTEPLGCTISGAPPVETGCEAGERCEPFACTNSIPPTCVGTCTDPSDNGEETVCGTILGLTCDKGEICDFGVGQCQVADAAGVCRTQPDVCPQIFDPVCGCDGVTYGNACEALAAGAQIDFSGSCR